MEKDTSFLPCGITFNSKKFVKDFARFKEKKENDEVVEKSNLIENESPSVELEEAMRDKSRTVPFIPAVDSATLPLDICREILILLPAKSLIRLRAVCKDWRSVIDDPFFVKAHTDKQLSSKTIIIRNSTGPPFHPLYSFDLDDLNFANGLQEIAVAPLDYTPSGLTLLQGALPVSMCNGLILVGGKSWEIWNPLTHERLKLPRGKCNRNPRKEAFGLGYGYTSDDFKVVVIHNHRLNRRGHGRENFACQTHVYSLISDSWRNVGSCPYYDYEWSGWGPRGPGVFLHGALHWTRFLHPYGMDMIIAFDLGSEKYRQLPAPPLRRERTRLNVQNRYLHVLDGCLVVSDFCKSNFLEDELEHYDLWVMKDYGVEDSWIKLFSLEDEECTSYGIGYKLRPVAYMKDKTQILLQNYQQGWANYYSEFFMFDVKCNSMKRVEIHGLTGTLHTQFIPRTIFRLHDKCGVNGSVTTNRRRRRRMNRTSNMKMADTN
ncbi:hypothetical protein CASFOL_032119 [Castilleja foliolosa]|uniref:F-box domain-containing protein n=1 Tax=Castilleja foliolosa TaxID=1961234 RepID=A0ABD3C0I1_9LAMI